MKKLLTICVLIILLLALCKRNEETSFDGNDKLKSIEGSKPSILFENDFYDFGTILEGEKKIHTFVFLNSGRSDLIIHAVMPDCSCTAVDWPKEPISPGEKREVKIVFDSKGLLGSQLKTITLKTNTYFGRKTISIKANVIKNKHTN